MPSYERLSVVNEPPLQVHESSRVPSFSAMEHLSYQQRSCKSRTLRTCRNNALSIITFVGVIIGVGIGIALRKLSLNDAAILWISMPGTIYLRLLQLTILPMIAGRVLLVTATLTPKQHGKVGIVALVYLLLANFLGAGIGMAIGILMNSSSFKNSMINQSVSSSSIKSPSTSDIFSDLLLNMFPDNILAIGLFNTGTRYELLENLTLNKSNEKHFKRIVEAHRGTNMIGLLLTATLMGLAAQKVAVKSKYILEFFDSAASIVEQIVKWVLKLTPIGACFMIAGAVVSIKSELSLILNKLGWFFCTFLITMLLQLVILSLLILVITKRNPLKFFFIHSSNAYLVTVATGVPMIAIPYIYESCDKNGISTRISRFIAPLSTVLKSDGSASFIMTSLVFAAGMSGNITITQLGISSLICGILAFAVPPIPSASMILIITLMSNLNAISDEAVGMLFAIEWLTDRIRSGNNTLSTLTCILLTNHIGDYLDPLAMPLLEPVDETINDLEIDDVIEIPTIDDEVKMGGFHSHNHTFIAGSLTV